jgi:hypothetical protein
MVMLAKRLGAIQGFVPSRQITPPLSEPSKLALEDFVVLHPKKCSRTIFLGMCIGGFFPN